MKNIVGVLALIGALYLLATAVGYMESNVAEYERTHNCGFVPEAGMYRCNRGR